MQIKKLKLENFKGVKQFEINLDGHSMSIYGDNGTGKSSLFDAYSWILYGKPSTGEKNFSPQTTGTHNLDHSVEMEVMLDGVEGVNPPVTTFKKVYHEVYKTQRGSADKIFSGYTTDYYVDGVPVREKDYKAEMEGVFGDEETAKLLTRPFYFLGELDIKARKKLLLDICGGIDDEDVLRYSDELRELPAVLQAEVSDKAIEQYMSIAKAKKKKIDKELKEIPARIDEAEKSAPKLTGESEEDLTAMLKGAEAEKGKLNIEKMQSKATAGSDIAIKISDVKAAKAKAQASHTECIAKHKIAAQEKIMALKASAGDIERGILQAEKQMKYMEVQIKEAEIKREHLRTEYSAIASEKFEGGTTCPTCGQPLPIEMIEDAKKRFNAKKAQQLEEIKLQGQEVSKTVIDQLNEDLEKVRLSYTKLLEGKKEREDLAKEVEEGNATYPTFEETDICKEFDKQLEQLEKAAADESSTAIEKELGEKIEKLNTTITEINAKLFNISASKSIRERIKELEANQKELAKKYEKLERGMYLCELFNRSKAKMLDEKINSFFPTLKFKLSHDQVNGGEKDECEALIPCNGLMVPFSTANNAARINAGLEAIDVLGDRFNLRLPVWIDNCESVTSPHGTKTQQIRLYVSKDDKTLRCEG